MENLSFNVWLQDAAGNPYALISHSYNLAIIFNINHCWSGHQLYLPSSSLPSISYAALVDGSSLKNVADLGQEDRE